MIPFIKKHIRKFIVWIVGIAATTVIYCHLSKEPEFISEYGIITWDSLGAIAIGLGIIHICSRLASKKPICDEDEEGVDENRIQQCERHIKALHGYVEKIGAHTDAKFNELQEGLDKIALATKDVEKACKSLAKEFESHTLDCPPKYECQGCGELCDEMMVSDESVQICEHCHTPNEFKPIEQGFHMSSVKKTQKPFGRKSKKSEQ